VKKELGLGLYSLAGVYGRKDPEEIKRMLIYAVENGIEYFDVADQYGPAEEVLGSTLQAYRSRIRIATKVGVTKEGFDLSYNHIQKACRQSLKKLQTDYIDLYQIHFDDHTIPVAETVGALEDLQKEGLILEYGLGHLPLQRVKDYAKEGNPASLLLELSPVALQKYREYLPVCQEYKLPVITMGTTGRGILTGKIPPDHGFEPGDIRNLDPLFQRSLYQSALRVYTKLKELAEQLNKSPVQLTLAWVLGLAHVRTALVGPSRVAHLQENLGGTGWEIPGETGSEMETFLAREEEKKKEARYNDIQEILQGPLSRDRKRAAADLVYALEGLVDFGIATEPEVVPLFTRLMACYRHKETDNTAGEIKDKLVDLFAQGTTRETRV